MGKMKRLALQRVQETETAGPSGTTASELAAKYFGIARLKTSDNSLGSGEIRPFIVSLPINCWYDLPRRASIRQGSAGTSEQSARVFSTIFRPPSKTNASRFFVCAGQEKHASHPHGRRFEPFLFLPVRSDCRSCFLIVYRSRVMPQKV
jgi:hypothetical protein